MTDASLIALLPPAQRLALAYAQVSSRQPFLAFFALDARLAGIVRAASEPVLGQLRLAWWRDRLAEEHALWPAGEPVLAALHSWMGQHHGLGELVDGWEAMLGEAPLSDHALAQHATGRAAAFAALAGLTGCEAAAEDAGRMGHNWGLADLAAHVTHGDEQAAAAQLMAHRNWNQTALPRALRPLTVLHGLARREIFGRETTARRRQPIATILAAIRLGLLGR